MIHAHRQLAQFAKNTHSLSPPPSSVLVSPIPFCSGFRVCVGLVGYFFRTRVFHRAADDPHSAAQVCVFIHLGKPFLHGQFRDAKGNVPFGTV